MREGRSRAVMVLILLFVIIVASIVIVWAAGELDGADSTETAGLFPRAEKTSEDTMQVTFIPAFMDVKFDEVLIVIEHGGQASDQVRMVSHGNLTVGAFTVNVTDLAGDGSINIGDHFLISDSSGDALLGEYAVTFRWVKDGTLFGSTSLNY